MTGRGAVFAALACFAGMPALAQDEHVEAMQAALSESGCTATFAEARGVLAADGFSEAFVSGALTDLVFAGDARVDPGATLHFGDEVCPPADPGAAPPTPRESVSAAIRQIDGCAIREADLPTVAPAMERGRVTEVVRAMLADGEARVDRFTLRLGGEGCPPLDAEAPVAETLDARILASAAAGDCTLRQSQLFAAVPERDEAKLRDAVLSLVQDGAAEVDRFTLRLSEEACAAARR